MLHQIGAGRCGPVYRGDDPARGVSVAIKVLQVDLAPARARELVDALAALAARLPVHPAILAPIDAGLEQVTPYVVYPLADADALDVALREYGPAAAVDALPRLEQLAEALDRAAARGAWHGALHPRDVLVSAAGTWVSGLGLAPALERAGVRVAARRPYAAPEQVEGRASSPAGDVFALAAVAYEWLFGRRLAGPAGEAFRVPGQPGLDAVRLAQAFAGALAADPAARWSSCTAFVDALEAAVVDRHEARVESMARAARRGVRAPRVPQLPLDAEEDAVDSAAGEGGDEGGQGASDRVAAAERFDVVDGEGERALDLSVAVPARQEAEDGLELRAAVLDSEPALLDDEPPVGDGAEVDEAAGRRDARAPLSVAGPGAPVGAARRGGAGALVLAFAAGLALGGLAGYWMGERAGDVPRADAPAIAPPVAIEQPAPSAANAGEHEASATTTPAVSDAVEARSEPGPVGSAGQAASASAAPPAETGGTAATPTAAPGAGVARGRLLVRSLPSGAEVRVGGVARGRTPLALGDLALGTHLVEVTHEGYAVASQRVSLTAERPVQTLDLALRRAAGPAEEATGVLQVESRPSGATVRVDDREVGRTPLTLEGLVPGSYRVSIVRPGYRTWTTTARVVAGARTRVAASLEGERPQG